LDKALTTLDNFIGLREHKRKETDFMMPGTKALDEARSLFRQRRTRDALFPTGLFGEPAWDLLLTLYIARCEGRCLSIPKLTRKLDLRLADAREWVRALEASRLIQKGGPTDADEVRSICLSDTGFHTVTMMLLERPVTMLS
jgi:hypothetical protein